MYYSWHFRSHGPSLSLRRRSFSCVLYNIYTTGKVSFFSVGMSEENLRIQTIGRDLESDPQRLEITFAIRRDRHKQKWNSFFPFLPFRDWFLIRNASSFANRSKAFFSQTQLGFPQRDFFEAKTRTNPFLFFSLPGLSFGHCCSPKEGKKAD